MSIKETITQTDASTNEIKRVEQTCKNYMRPSIEILSVQEMTRFNNGGNSDSMAFES